MDQYAAIVGWAYLVSLALLALLLWQTVWRNARARRALEAQERSQEKRGGHAD
ncbi:MAG: heme exporter protein CcmD [Paracoccus sp. (in: a-proteobacteria)]|nr:heme exporter protein CcmD [Paracoccus sp. (in: a-proteobacteria)]